MQRGKLNKDSVQTGTHLAIISLRNRISQFEGDSLFQTIISSITKFQLQKYVFSFMPTNMWLTTLTLEIDLLGSNPGSTVPIPSSISSQIKPEFPLMLIVASLEHTFACRLGSRARWDMLRLQHVLYNILEENIYYQLYWEVPKTTLRFTNLLRDSQDSIYSCTQGYNLLQQKNTKHNQQREKVCGMKSRRKQTQISRCPPFKPSCTGLT